jgi:hypothetical protein
MAGVKRVNARPKSKVKAFGSARAPSNKLLARRSGCLTPMTPTLAALMARATSLKKLPGTERLRISTLMTLMRVYLRSGSHLNPRKP